MSGPIDKTTLNDLTPNLDTGDVADPALRKAAFQYLYDYAGGLYDEMMGLINAGTLSRLGIVNVRDYGAKGDGVTDDSVAIQTAINAAAAKGGGTVYFPTGMYKYATSLSLGNSVSISLIGEVGTSNVTLNYTGSGWAIDSSATTFASFGVAVRIKGLTIQLAAGCTGGINGAFNTPHIDDVVIKGDSNNKPGIGVYIGPISNAVEIDWGKLYVSYCQKGVVLNSDHVSIAHLQLWNNTTQLEIGATGSAPTGLSIQYLHCVTTLATIAIHVVKSSQTYMDCVYLEGPYTQHFSIEASAGLAATVIDSLAYESGQTFRLNGDPAYIDIRSCRNWNASSITNPFGSTNATTGGVARFTVGPVLGTSAAPLPNNSYLALSDMLISITGGTGVSISLQPRASGTSYNVGSTFTGYIRKGTYISFGNLTVQPSVTASYVG